MVNKRYSSLSINQTILLQEKPVQGHLSLSKKTQLLLMCSLGLNCLTLVLELSGWLIAFIVISLLWQSSIYLKLVAQPNRLIKLLVSIAGLFLLALSAKQLGLLNSMVHLLVFSYLLKPLELTSRKDFYIQVLLGIFVLVTSLVFIQSLYFMLLVLLFLTINFMLLFSIFYKTASHKTLAKGVTTTLIKSIPLTLLLFIGFPKIAPFWQMPAAQNAQVGLSDEVKVGDIAKLALSNKLAFRVEFDQAPPNYQQMYWRTLVLEDFDGIKWYQRKDNYQNLWQQQLQEEPDFSSIVGLSKLPLVSYQVIVEPNFQQWLFGLNIMTDVKSEQQTVNKNRDFTLTANKKLNSVTSYRVTSALTDNINIILTPTARNRNLLVNERNNQALADEGQRLRRLYQDDLSLVKAVLTRFNQQNYHYTLNPPLLSNNSLSEFYFDTKAGFCEHYASSFTYLMRSAGIPARMVLGYLGGEYNQRGNYYSVYQRDAHAWSEVWIAGRGWLRIDPTAAVSPERLETGFSELLQQEQNMLSSDLFASFNASQWFNQLRYMFEAIDYQWTKWVVGYSINDQINVINALYLTFVQHKRLIIAISVLMLAMIVVLISLRKKNKASRFPTEVLLLNKLIKSANKLGILKTPTLTADQLAQRIISEKPAASAAVLTFINTFKKVHYQSLSADERVKEIDKLKQQFKQLTSQLKQSG